uniref:M60 family metallopeptidase n=1 Tax=uncultured Draconibacterium sp. TaxID=1573823 RepID=UPI0032173E56
MYLQKTFNHKSNKTRIYRTIENYIFVFLSAILLFNLSCSKESVDVPQLELETTNLTFDRIGSVQTIHITTNQPVICETEVTWCTVSFSKDIITVETSTNQQPNKRTAVVTVTAGNLKNSFTVSQSGFNSYQNDLFDDIKISVKSASTTSFQPGSNIDKSIDGDFSTIYHSNWNNSGENYFPITLSYSFSNVATLDYLVYYPRQSGSNGHIKEFELWVATEDNPTLSKYGDYDFKGSSAASRLTFSPALVKPTTIQLVVKSGSGDKQGFVSCAEMNFYKRNPENFRFQTIFTDNTCSELKPGLTETTLMAIPNKFYRDLALEIFRGEFDSEFRVQDYRPWQDPRIMSAINKTSTYSLRDNPTGIYVSSSDELIFFADNPNNENISILVQDLEKGYGGNTYPVADGLNKITISSGGLIYVMYHTEDATENPVKINFVTGSVNGYFDRQKHSNGDWNRIISGASYKHFDVLGTYAHLTFPTEKFRENTPDGLALINKYDDLVRLEWEFMGLFKYNKPFKNRMYFHVVYTDSYMYSTSYRTAYVTGTMDLMCNLNRLTTSCWGPAHEVGHSNQTRPGLKWIGMTEVTTNIHSLFVQTSWGNESRLVAEDKYSKAITDIVDENKAHNASSNVFYKLVPFWQLKLYLMDALGKTDFYKDLYEYMRNQDYSLVTNDGFYQLDFVRAVCKISNLDLTDFFTDWGFLTPINMTIKDYSTKNFTITQKEIDDLKEEIAAQNYPKPKHNQIYKITDNNVSDYK